MMKKTIVRLLVVLLILLQLPIQVYATSPSTTTTFAPRRLFGIDRTQDAYLPGHNISNLGLNTPENMAVCPYDLLYIADTGNRRVVVFDTSTHEIIREINHPGFRSPRGVFVTHNNILYVADAGAEMIWVFTAEGEYIRSISEPSDMPLMDIPFAPNRVAVDQRGNIYVVGEGVFNGIMHISTEGEFMGFFTANHTNLTFAQRMQNIFMTQRQLEGLTDRNPLTFSNVTVDSRGIVYTTTMGPMRHLQGEGIKRHDMSGRNTIDSFIYGSDFIDIVVNNAGLIFAASAGGSINVYTSTGELIFFFGAVQFPGTRHEDIAGWFRQLQSLAVTSDGTIWGLDRNNAILQSFVPTDYALTIYTAIDLFNRGMYEESGHYWEEVLRRNQMSVLAHNGIGRTYLYRHEFELAQHHFFLAGSQFYYSTAFWETRNEWLLNNLNYVIILIFIFFLCSFIVRHFDKKKVVAGNMSRAKKALFENHYLAPVFFAFTMARHPVDSTYYMKLKQKGNYIGATILLAVFFITYMLYQTSRGFVIQYLSVENMDFVAIIGMFWGAFVLFVISNYLVTSIKGGEGGLGDVYKLVSYTSLPMSITLVANTILSHVVTHNELFLLSFFFWAGLAYFASILWVGLMEMHNYSFGTNVASIIITICFMLVIIVVAYIITILFGEVTAFFDSIRWEVFTIVQTR